MVDEFETRGVYGIFLLFRSCVFDHRILFLVIIDIGLCAPWEANVDVGCRQDEFEFVGTFQSSRVSTIVIIFRYQGLVFLGVRIGGRAEPPGDFLFGSCRAAPFAGNCRVSLYINVNDRHPGTGAPNLCQIKNSVCPSLKLCQT